MSNRALVVILIILIIIGGIFGVIYYKQNSIVPHNFTPGELSGPTGTTTTPQTNSTTTATTTPPNNDPLAAWKPYINPTLGVAFKFPKDFFFTLDKVSADNLWTSTFTAPRGQIDIFVGKTVPGATDTRLKSTTVKAGGKDFLSYTTRRDACDVQVFQSQLDVNSKIQVSFTSCGSKNGSIVGEPADITTLLSTLTFSNTNSTYYSDPVFGIAFRYPYTLNKPVSKKVGTLTTLDFGSKFTISTGIHLDPTAKKNLSAKDLATQQATATSTTLTPIKINGRDAYELIFTPTSGTKERTIYATNKNDTDVLIIKQTGVDSLDLDLITSSLFWISK